VIFEVGAVDGSLVVAAQAPMAAGFEVEFAEEGGGRRREPLSSCWDVEFEKVPPVRKFPSRQGQRHYPGAWWFSSTGGHVGFESWLERDVVMLLDADPDVVAVASQPFWLAWPVGLRTVRHAPDFFARCSDGSAVVIDVRADDRIEPEDAVKFEVTAKACAAVGWEYQRIGALAPVLAANLRWLSGYRHPRYGFGGRVAEVLRAFNGPVALMEGTCAAGDPVAVLPVVFSLLWRRVLLADLSSVLLGPESVVRPAGDLR